MRSSSKPQTDRATKFLARAGIDVQSLATRIRRGVVLRRMRELRVGDLPFLATAWDDLRREAIGGGVEAADTERLESLLMDYSWGLPGKATGVGFVSPAVSVLMVSRNRAYCIGDAIRSVQAQSFEDWELIVVDDGSTDGTRDVVAGFSNDKRIRYTWQPPTGMASARNHSLRLAKGVFIAYLDDDNLFYPGFLAAAVGAFSRDQNIDCLYGALVTDAHRGRDRTWILFEPFDRERLLQANFIDAGVLVHRRALVETHGGADENLDCYCDWDFVLRITRDKPAISLPVLSTRYRVMDGNRMSDQRPSGVDYFKVKRKWFTVPTTSRLPRVLYLVGFTERYVQAELRCMRQWGVDVVFSYENASGGLMQGDRPSDRPTLADAIRAASPDVIHVHGLATASAHSTTLAGSGQPVTIWARESLSVGPWFEGLLAENWVRRIYGTPGLRVDGREQPKLRMLKPAFDTSVFRPSSNKDRRLVLQVSDTPSLRGVKAFFDIATRCPSHRFVMVIAAARLDDEAAKVVDKARRRSVAGEFLVDMPPDELRSLQARAGLYLDTVFPRGADETLSVGGSIAIVEAMATGAYVVVPKGNPLAADIGKAGRRYRTLEAAAALINESVGWSDADWHQAWLRSVNRSFRIFADELVFRPLFDDWCGALEGAQ